METGLLITFIISALVQLGLIVWLSAGLSPRQTHNKPRSVSVIIAARNEADHLKNLLDALKNQNHPDYEVILVDDRSNDGSKEILKPLEHLEWIKVITVEKLEAGWNGKKYALHLAIKKAKNDVLLFTDADCLPCSNDWIGLMTDSISDQIKIVLGFSKYKSGPGLLNQLTQFETINTALHYLGFASKGLPYMAVGRNWAVARDIYPTEKLIALAHITGGDDDLIAQEICHGKNTITQVDSHAFTVTSAENSWKSYLKQKTRHLSVGIKYSTKIKTLLAIFPLTQGSTWVTLLALLVIGQWKIPLLILGIRSLSFYIIFKRLGQKLDSKLSIWALPLIDLCYPFWYAFVGIRSLAAKQIEWKAESSFLKKH